MLVERAMVPDAKAFEPAEIWPGLTDMSRLQKMLWSAKRPIALVGGSRWSEAACAALARFAERFALPVATTFRRQYLFDGLHPCYAGDMGIGPNPKLLARVKGADLVLLIGGRLSEMATQVPISPSLASSATSSYGKRDSRSSSSATGATRSRANSRTVWRTSSCSSVRSKSTAGG